MRKWPWFLLSIGIVVADQWTKYWAATNLIPYQPKALLPMLNFTLAFNSGAAFSFFKRYW
ncbi:signal peptidase II [Legionella hackeliae]|nr:signal peptidase II [Legionella hackeliae]